jgi:1,4-dihydroxy-2-naphthoate octaprenyltransferase
MSFTAGCGAFLVFRGGLIIAFLVALALILALAYTSGPLPLSYLGIAEYFILIFFGPVASGFTYYLQTLEFAAAPFWAGLSPGMISCGILIINNLRDVDQDREVKKKTLVVRFGPFFGKWEYNFAVILPFLIPPFLASYHPWVLLSCSCLLPAYSLCRSVFLAQSPRDYPPLFAKTGRLLLLYTVTFCLGILI